MSDEALLVARCLKGDGLAVQSLIERFQPDVFALCVRLLQHRQDAEDVSQEVFLRVFRSLHRWDRDRPLKPWIIGIAINRCRTWITQRKRRPELVDYLGETAESQPGDDSEELVREIQTALTNLRPDYRLVFVLFHEQGMAYEEIAGQLARPVGTIKTWLHRARLEVLECLRQRGMISEVDHELP